MRRRKTVFVDADILVVGGGMGGCGAAYEARYWGRDLKIVCVASPWASSGSLVVLGADAAYWPSRSHCRVRSPFRPMGNGKDASVSHHRLIADVCIGYQSPDVPQQYTLV